jgi:transcriptional regulator with XRE-family HTH domain
LAVDRAARRAADRARTAAATDLARLIADAGIPIAALARGSGVDAAFIARILRGQASASTATYARLATALGADLSIRLYPNTGPTIRDRHQAGIAECLLAIRHPRWRPYLEVAVRRPSRGWIDVVLHDPGPAIVVATEIQSDIRRIEQMIRWASEKVASLPSWDRWPTLGEQPTVSQLLIVRDTRTTRAVAREHARVLRAAYPAHPDDALASLAEAEAWPGPSLLWATGRGTPEAPWRIVSRS